jgi:hypothetical protein
MSWYPRKVTSQYRLAGSNGGTVDEGQIANVRIAPLAINTTSVHAAAVQPATGTTVLTTGITNPDVPRTLRLVGNTSTVTGNVVIAGTDSNGDAITETVAMNGTTAVETTRAFHTVTSITLPARGASGDSVSVGLGSKVGLYHHLTENTVLKSIFNGAVDAGTVSVHAEVSKNLYTPAGTFDGTKVLVLIYVA